MEFTTGWTAGRTVSRLRDDRLIVTIADANLSHHPIRGPLPAGRAHRGKPGVGGTRHDLQDPLGDRTETVTLSGPTTLAGAPATMTLKMVVRWKAGPSGSSGTATISRNPPSGQRRLCANNTCPAYGPMIGTATITGTVTPTAGGTPVSCASSKTLKAAFGQGAPNLVRTLEIYKMGTKRLVTVDPPSTRSSSR